MVFCVFFVYFFGMLIAVGIKDCIGSKKPRRAKFNRKCRFFCC